MTTYLIVCSTITIVCLLCAIVNIVNHKAALSHEYRMKYPPKEPKVERLPSIKTNPGEFATYEWTTCVDAEPKKKRTRLAAEKGAKRGKAK